MTTVQHRRFDLGINQDQASYLLDEGYVYSSKNMLYDKLGIARKRGGITGIGATASTYNWDHLGILLKDDGTTSAHAMRSLGSVYTALLGINLSTGAFTVASTSGASILGTSNDGGRPFQHYGFLTFPMFSDGTLGDVGALCWSAGSTSGGYTLTFGATLTAGNKQVTVNAADSPLAHMTVGDTFRTTGTAPSYVGRVTRLVSATVLEVYPTPTTSIVSLGGSSFPAGFCQGIRTGVNEVAVISGKVGISYQGRVLQANCTRSTSAGLYEYYARRVYFSSTLLEADASGFTTYQGMVSHTPNGFPNLNYFDVPGNDPITAMCATGFGDLVIFSGTRSYRMTGNLTTQYGTGQSVTWQVREIPNSVGCISERGMQRTPKGVIFPHISGIYATDGSSMLPLMNGRITKLWKGLAAGTGFTIYGSGLLYGNHYYICGTSNSTLWGLLLNLDTLAWSSLGGKTSYPASWIVNSTANDPANPSLTYALKWWDKPTGFVSFANGQLERLETIFSPTSANRTDADAPTTVNFEVVTRPYSEDTPTKTKVWKQATIEYANKGGAAVTVTPQTVLDSANLAAGGTNFTLPRQDAYTITAATNAAPIVITCGAHDIKVDSWVQISGVLGNLGANGPHRVQAVTATTVTLVGSLGTGAYTSGGTIQQLDSRDIGLDTILMNTGVDSAAIVYRINDTDSGGTQGADSFELQGITHTFDERDPHAE